MDPIVDADPIDLSAWIGRTEEAEDAVSPNRAAMLAACLDLDDATRRTRGIEPGGPLPPLWHWIAFLAYAPMSELGGDGHPKRGGFLPPVPLERRMWAGGRLSFPGDIRIGERLHRRSEILSVTEKTGGSGRMVFVTVGHRISTERGLAIEEEHDIVYVALPETFRLPPPVPAPAAPDWSEAVPIDPVRLFRYSAATFNGHRIHYDLDYAGEVEKYPGLVVHGPLQATLMMEAAQRHRPDARPAAFRFRGVRPLFHFETAHVLGEAGADGEDAVCTATADGHVCMKASVAWSR